MRQTSDRYVLVDGLIRSAWLDAATDLQIADADSVLLKLQIRRRSRYRLAQIQEVARRACRPNELPWRYPLMVEMPVAEQVCLRIGPRPPRPWRIDKLHQRPVAAVGQAERNAFIGHFGIAGA